MAAVLGIAKNFYGNNDGEDQFLIVSDGTKTQFLFPLIATEDIIEDLLIAFGNRLSNTDSNDPEDVVASIAYNTQYDISASDPMDSYEEAMQRAQDYMALVNDFEEGPTYTVYDPITKKTEEEEEN